MLGGTASGNCYLRHPPNPRLANAASQRRAKREMGIPRAAMQNKKVTRFGIKPYRSKVWRRACSTGTPDVVCK
jgi:hypothetical protein